MQEKKRALESATMQTLSSVDPGTGEVIDEVPVADAEALAAAVTRARSAQGAWADLGPAERARRLLPAGERILEYHRSLAELVTREMGKPLAESLSEVTAAGRAFERVLPELERAFAPETLAQGELRSTVYHEPFGVCAAITPWNFPVMMPQSLVVPALMAGNAVILKPSEKTPLCGQHYVELLGRDLPPGVLQVVHGDASVGRALVAGPVDLIAFTGSRAAGKEILGAASAELKRVVLELGGKDPLLILDDADLEAAAAFAARNSFRNAGQVCVSTERIYVHEAIAARFESRLAELAAELRQGYGLDADVELGPMVDGGQRERVIAQVAAAQAAGATLVCGGQPGEGNHYPPTVLTGVTHDMAIMRDETFGPVACVQRYRDVDEGIRLANDTPYGLGAVVFGGDVARAEAVARRLEAGMVGVNRSCGGVAGTPWVGHKQSGYGYHGGVAGHRQFSAPRVVTRAAES